MSKLDRKTLLENNLKTSLCSFLTTVNIIRPTIEALWSQDGCGPAGAAMSRKFSVVSSDDGISTSSSACRWWRGREDRSLQRICKFLPHTRSPKTVIFKLHNSVHTIQILRVAAILSWFYQNGCLKTYFKFFYLLIMMLHSGWKVVQSWIAEISVT